MSVCTKKTYIWERIEMQWNGQKVWVTEVALRWILHSIHPAGYEFLWYCTRSPSGFTKPRTREKKMLWERTKGGGNQKMGITGVNKEKNRQRENEMEQKMGQ